MSRQLQQHAVELGFIASRAMLAGDAHGRVAPQCISEDDQLEIPAFLRRQSS